MTICLSKKKKKNCLLQFCKFPCLICFSFSTPTPWAACATREAKASILPEISKFVFLTWLPCFSHVPSTLLGPTPPSGVRWTLWPFAALAPAIALPPSAQSLSLLPNTRYCRSSCWPHASPRASCCKCQDHSVPTLTLPLSQVCAPHSEDSRTQNLCMCNEQTHFPQLLCIINTLMMVVIANLEQH